MATWAEVGSALGADLLAGNQDPRAGAPELLAALPSHARSARVRLRAEGGYFAGQLARAALGADIEFAVGAHRVAPLWPALSGIAETDWTEAIDRAHAQVAVADYTPGWWPATTRLVIRRDATGPDHPALHRPPRAAAPHPAPGSADPAAGRASRDRGRVWLQCHPHQPRRFHRREGHRGRTLVPPGAAVPGGGYAELPADADPAEHPRQGCGVEAGDAGVLEVSAMAHRSPWARAAA